MSILVSGSLAYDHIMNFPDSFKNHIMPDKIHILNVCFVVDKLEKSWGGTAGNIAYSMKLLGAEPIVVGALGKDGGEYVEHFKKHGISMSGITIDPEILTASAYITTDQDDNQVIAFFGGPHSDTNTIELKNIAPTPKLALISPTRKEVMQKHLRDARALGMKIVFDPGQQITVFDETELRSMIDEADILIGNDYEITLLQERTGWSADDILTHTSVMITTLGERGSIISESGKEPIEVAACIPASFDDPTGAGDAYRAGFFFGYEKGLDLRTCAKIGSVSASYAIETYGTQGHTFTIEQFAERYEKCYGEKLSFRA